MMTLLCFTSYCRHLSLSVIHGKRISKRRTVIVASLLLSDFIMWISCSAAPALAKCSAAHELRFRRPNFALLLTTISSTRATTKRIARLFVGVGVVVTDFGRPCTSPRSTTPDERLRPPFKLKLCHTAPLATPLPVGAKKIEASGIRTHARRLRP